MISTRIDRDNAHLARLYRRYHHCRCERCRKAWAIARAEHNMRLLAHGKYLSTHHD